MIESLINNISTYSNIVFVGGGTGGHIQPIVSLKKILKKSNKESALFWIGGADSQEKIVAKEEEIKFFEIPTLKLATTKSLRVLLYPYVLLQGVYQARKILTTLPSKDTIVFSKGGPGSVAVGIAAWSTSIPLYIHESDTIAGRSNRLLGVFATKIFLGFEQTKQQFKGEKCEVIGQIIDPIFSQKNIETGGSSIFWKTNKPHILVVCGSQGSKTVFESLIAQFSHTTNYEWIIALGKLNAGMLDEFGGMENCQAVKWLSQANMAKLIQESDIVITRGSATTLAELTASEHKPKLIIIPLPYSAGNHQYYNAQEYEKIGHILVEQSNLNNMSNILLTITNNEGNRTKN